PEQKEPEQKKPEQKTLALRAASVNRSLSSIN
ncbi:MAG: hypothetical protein ACI97K_003013, partial [Glaciecola sp.]